MSKERLMFARGRGPGGRGGAMSGIRRAPGAWRLASTMAVLGFASPLGAQSTGTPIFQAPYRAFARSEFAISLSEPGSGFDLEAAYRGGFTRRVDVGIRGGFHNEPDHGGTDALIGSDLRARVITHTESFPFDASFTAGLGFRSGHGFTEGRVPLGLSMGRRVLIEG